MSLYLLKNVLDQSTVDGKASQKRILTVLFIPSVFLRTSVALRESPTIVETTFFGCTKFSYSRNE